MVNVLYGVAGEGSGHSSRAREVAGHLCRAGHRVLIASYDRGYRNLSPDFDVMEIEGLTIGASENRVSLTGTLEANIRKVPGLRTSWQAMRSRGFEGFQPDVVFTDFEPLSAHLARRMKVPLVSIDNQHRMRFMSYPRPPGLGLERRMAVSAIRAMIPVPDRSLVTTFWFGDVTHPGAYLFPPILRGAVRDAVSTRGDHVLVYVTKPVSWLLDKLRSRRDEEFRLYGFEREGSEGNLTFRPFSLEGFLADLAGSRGVIGTAGFSLITESMYLGKPYLAFPLAGQFEQHLNAFLLEKLGCGMDGSQDGPSSVDRFLRGMESMESAASMAGDWDHGAIFRKVDELLAGELVGSSPDAGEST